MNYNGNQSWQQGRIPAQWSNIQQQQVTIQQMQHRSCPMPTNSVPQYMPINSNSSRYQPQQQQYLRGQPQVRISSSQYSQGPGNQSMNNFMDPFQSTYQQYQMVGQQIQQCPYKFDDDEFVEPRQINQNSSHNSYDLNKLLKFELNATYSRCKLKPDQPQYLPATVTLNAIEQQQMQQSNMISNLGVDLICVIDISGSMMGDKLQMVQHTLIQLLEQLREQDRLCLIEFNDSARRLTTLRRITKVNKNYFRSVINQMCSDGGTTIASGTILAFKQIKERKYTNNVTSIFILSDGQDEVAEAAVAQQLKTVNSQLTIHSFGFGSDHDAPMMTKLCNLRSGSFYFVNDVSLLDEFFVDALGGLVSVVGEQVEITVRCSSNHPYSGIKISKTHGAMWKPIQQHKEYQISIPHLAEGQRKDYVLELLLPNLSSRIEDHQREVIVLEAQVRLVNTYTKAVTIKQAQLKLSFYNQDQQMPVNIYNIDVAIQYYRVKAAETISEARRLCEQNHFQKAQEMITSMLVNIRSNPNLAKAATSVIQDLEQTQNACQPNQFMAYGQQQMCQMVSNNMNQQGINAQFDQHGRQQQPVNQAVFQNSTQARMVSQVQMSKLSRY